MRNWQFAIYVAIKVSDLSSHMQYKHKVLITYSVLVVLECTELHKSQEWMCFCDNINVILHIYMGADKEFALLLCVYPISFH